MTTVGPSRQDWAPLAPEIAEAELRQRLAGRRLVVELGLSDAEFRRYRKSLFSILRGAPSVGWLRRSYPALLVTYLAYQADQSYGEEGFWPSAHRWFQHQTVVSERGELFRNACRDLDLETFDVLVQAETARAWLSRILAHGGIPKSAAEPYARRLARELGEGVTDPEEMLVRWKRDGAEHQFGRPVLRFMRYGGAAASDLHATCVDVARDLLAGRDPGESVLPGYLVDELRKAVDEDRSAIRRARDRLEVQPTIIVDPFINLGPTVVLPAVPPEMANARWRTVTGGRVRQVDASSYSEDQVPCGREGGVRLELASDSETREWAWELLSAGLALAFSPQTQQLLPSGRPIAGEDVWLLAPRESEIRAIDAEGETAEALELSSLPELSGDWSGFAVRHLDLRDVSELKVTAPGQPTSERFAIRVPRGVPAITTAPAAEVAGPRESPVFADVPEMQVPDSGGPEWKLRLTPHGGIPREARVPAAGGRFALDDLFESLEFGDYRLIVRGALGATLRAHFSYVPELEVSKPVDIVFPNESTAEIELRAEGVEPRRLRAVDTSGASTLTRATLAHSSGRKLPLSVRVPQLHWTVSHDTKPTLGLAANTLPIAASEFDDELADRLVVRTGRPGVRVSVALLDGGGRRLGELEPAETRGVEGRWSFNLGPLSDAIRAQRGAPCALELRVGSRTVTAASIVGRRALVWDFKHSPADPECRSLLIFPQDEAGASSKVLRLWSLARPWLPHRDFVLADGVSMVTVDVGDLTPGPYLAHVVIPDPWLAVRRPRSADRSRLIKIGTPEAWEAWIGGLPPDDPRSLITWVQSGWRGETTFDSPRIAEASDEAAACLAVALAETPPGHSAGAKFVRLARVVSSTDRALAATTNALAELAIDESELDRFEIQAASAIEPVSDPVDELQLRRLWEAAPAIACEIDLPWAGVEDASMLRATAALGIDPNTTLDPDGALINQLVLGMPLERLRELQFQTGLVPSGLLDSQTRTLASFEWLQRRLDGSLAAGELEDWLAKFGDLAQAAGGLDHRVEYPELQRHLDARMPSGAESIAEIPVVLLSARAVLRWSDNPKAVTRAREALDAAVAWAPLLVRSDAVLVQVMEFQTRPQEDA